MKLLLLTAVLCLVFSKALDHKNGKDVLEALQGGNNEVYVILFHAGASKGQAVTSKTQEYQAALQGIQKKFPSFTYTTVDASNRSYDDLIDAISLIRSELDKSPSVLIMHKGNGEWIHGPQTISKIFEFAPAYEKRMSE